MLSKLLSYKKGYVRLKITGSFTERFINICMARKIKVWDIEKTEKNVLFLSMYARDFLNIRPVARKTRSRVKIISKHGIFVSAKKYKKRKLFFAGAALFFLFLLVFSDPLHKSICHLCKFASFLIDNFPYGHLLSSSYSNLRKFLSVLSIPIFNINIIYYIQQI